MGNKWTTELGQTFLNTLAMPAEMVVGQNFYDPTFTSKMGKGMNAAQDVATGIGGGVVPMAANAILPGSGQALSMARGLTPDLGTQGTQLQGHNNNQSGYGMGEGAGQLAGQMGLFPFGGAFGQGQGDQSGPNLNTFNGPSHEQGGMQINPNVEIQDKETIDPKAEYVYSDKIINPETKNDFAADSKKWKGSDKDDDITKKTNKLMLDRLRNGQESVKKAKFEKDAKKFEKKYGGYLKEQYAQGGYYTPAEAAADGKTLSQSGVQYGGTGNGGVVQYWDGGAMSLAQGDIEQGYIPGINDPNVNQQYMDPSGSSAAGQFNVPGYQAPASQGAIGQQWTPNQQSVNPQMNIAPEAMNATPGSMATPGINGQGFDWTNAANQVGEYANIGYNLKRGVEPVDHYKSTGNPEYNKAIALAEGRNYDITQAQADVRTNLGRTRDALAQAASGEAGYLSNMQGAQINADKQSQALYDLQNNKNNQYRMEEARMRTGLGSEEMNRLNQEELYRLRGNAAQESMLDAATQGMSNVAGRNLKGSNQAEQDQRLLAMYKSQYGDYGTMQKEIEAFEKKKKRTKKSK